MMPQSWVGRPKRWLDSDHVLRRYGISDPVLWTWLHGAKPTFPEPTYRNGRRYWDQAELDHYDDRVAKSAMTGARI